MGLKAEILQIVFGAFLLGIFIQVGILSPDNSFWNNVISGIVIFLVSRLLGFLFGGR